MLLLQVAIIDADVINACSLQVKFFAQFIDYATAQKICG